MSHREILSYQRMRRRKLTLLLLIADHRVQIQLRLAMIIQEEQVESTSFLTNNKNYS